MKTSNRVNSGVSRRAMLRAAGVAGSAAATAVLMQACSGSDKNESSTTGAAAGSPAATSRSAAATAAANIPAEFVVANESEPPDLLPYASGFGGWLVTRQVYETLVETRMTLKPSGVAEIGFTPYLAESWTRPEPTRWRFKLRPGVTFHNGEPWNAAAAKFSFDTMADNALAAKLKKTALLGRTFQGVEVVDDLTFDVITKAPDAETLGLYLRIGFAAMPPKLVGEKGIEALQENPVGTGPYRFKSWARGQEIKLERNPTYWKQDGPNMQSVRYIVRKEAAIRAQTVKAGEAHFAYNIGAEQAQGIKNTVIGGGFQSSGIRVNNQIAPTNDVRLRKALNHALDRNAIVKSIFRGAAAPIAFFGFQPVKLEPYPYKPDEAKKLIDAAGARGATLELVYGETRIPEEDQLGEVYKASFEAVGLKINLRKVEPQQYNEIGTRPFPQQPPLYMETTSSGNYGEIAGGLNDKYGCNGTGTFCKPEFDAEYAQLAALEGEARNVKLQSIADRLHNDETPRVWVAAVQQVHGFADFVKPNLPLNAFILFNDIKVG